MGRKTGKLTDDHRNDDESLFDDCYFHYKAEGFVAISDDNGVVHSIQVEENAILDSGISAASSMDEVIEHYGQGYERSESDFMFQPGILIITLFYPRSNGRLEFSFSEGRLTGKVTPRKLLLTTASNH